MKHHLGVLLLLCLSWLAQAAPPNLLLIIADDCTYRDLGVYGGQAKTPHLDQLAAEGMKFTRCFQAAPMCSPTRNDSSTTTSTARRRNSSTARPARGIAPKSQPARRNRRDGSQSFALRQVR
jgi:arylsulfatase A-like enzyme